MIDFRHHLFLRKLVHQNLVQYPHPEKWKRNLDKIIFIVSIVGPAASLPQVGTIWIDKNASGVSAVSWSFFTLFAFLWLFYGIAHRVKPIIINSAISVFINIFVVVGVLIYS